MNNCACTKVCSSSGQFVDVTGLCDVTQFDLTTNRNWTQISIPAVFNIPIQKPDIEELNSENITVQILRKRVIETPVSGGDNLEGKILTGRKLVIEGLICKQITYTANEESQPIHSAHATVPFSAYIVLPAGTPLTDNFEVKACVEDVFISEICKRQIFQNITLFLQAVPAPGLACEDQGEECTEEFDTVSVKGVTPGNVLLALPTGNMWTQIIVSENLSVPEQKPDIEQINGLVSHVDIISKRVVRTPGPIGPNSENTLLTGRKLIIEGVLKQKISYTAEVDDGSQPLHSVHFDIPFSAFIVITPGTPTNAVFKVEAFIEDIFICAVDSRQVFKNSIIFIKATRCV